MTGGVDRARIARAVRELLAAIGEDPDRVGLERTPERVADSYAEFFAGLAQNPVDHLRETVHTGDSAGELVLVRDIEFRSVCEHHLLPFRGRAHVAYRPANRVAGLSSLPRVVLTLAARPQVQERLGEQIVDALVEGLAPKGVLVVIEARHGCMSDRGVSQETATAVTVASRGVLAEPVMRSEVMSLIGEPQR